MRLKNLSSLQRQLSTTSPPSWTPPVFLCPALLTTRPVPRKQHATLKRQHHASHVASSKNKQFDIGRESQRRWLHVEFGGSKVRHDLTAAPTQSGLPLTCPGCGAYSQTKNPDTAGFYDVSQKLVKHYLRKNASHRDSSASEKTGAGGGFSSAEAKKEAEQRFYKEALDNLDQETRENLGLSKDAAMTASMNSTADIARVPVCDRCHNLLNHSRGVSIAHPDLETIRAIIEESPHKRNNIYHVVDAVDFPMSLIRGVYDGVGALAQKRQRRSKKAETGARPGTPALNFIITRADLLAPTKQLAEELMVPMRRILLGHLGKQYLGRDIEQIKIGKVRCVSAMRGWWTKEVKEDIKDTVGATWLLGKVNVGKSKLVETVLPKKEVSDHRMRPSQASSAHRSESHSLGPSLATSGSTSLILPPAAVEEGYPVMPVISHVPGTTAQPIRLRYGNGKGELVDLPGIDRDDMTPFVKPEKQGMLVMRERVKATQQVIRPGQSLMIGDLVRITPNWRDWNEAITETTRSPDMVLLAAAFVPFKTHVTSTEKAVAGQAQERRSSGTYEELLADGAGTRIASAGKFAIRWDETKRRAGPLTRKDAIGLQPERLPFRVCSADIVLEGIGWVELNIQIRRKRMEEAGATELGDLGEDSMPAVEIFSPDGGHVLARPSLGLFQSAGRRSKPASQRSQRPRKSMKGVKKAAKRAERARKQEAMSSDWQN